MTVSDNLIYFPDGCSVALGSFDGVHLGHCAVIEKARSFGLPTVVITGKQHPLEVLLGKQHHLICSRSVFLRRLETLGVDMVIMLDFNSIRNLTAVEFLDMICLKTGAKNLICGFNHSFGKGAAGSCETIVNYAREHGLGAAICPPIQIDGQTVSSTHIRSLIANGDMEQVSSFLGYNYTVDAVVTRGEQRGRTIGFPTVNQIYDDRLVLPKFGVYASRTNIDGRFYPSMTNIGIRPTFRSERVLAETYIGGFSGDLYDRPVDVELLRFIRNERQFSSLSALKTALEHDAADCIK